MQRLFAATFAYNNGAPNSKLPALGWSSWVALGPGAEHPIFDYCDESGVMAAVDAFHAVGLYCDASVPAIFAPLCAVNVDRNPSLIEIQAEVLESPIASTFTRWLSEPHK